MFYTTFEVLLEGGKISILEQDAVRILEIFDRIQICGGAVISQYSGFFSGQDVRRGKEFP